MNHRYTGTQPASYPPQIVFKAAMFVSSILLTLALLTNAVSTYNKYARVIPYLWFKLSRYVCLVNPPYACFANKCTISTLNNYYRAIPYAFPGKPSDELFPCVYFAAYGCLSGCHPHNGLTLRTSTSPLTGLSGAVFLAM